MKRLTIIASIFFMVLMMSSPAKAQVKDPGDPGGTPSGPPLGGGAPIGGGLFILLGLGAAYGGKKLYRLFDEEKNENKLTN